jgi:hypothetical protein
VVWRNDKSNYLGIAILSAIAKLLELLVYKVMYENLKSRLVDFQQGFVKDRSTVSNLIEGQMPGGIDLHVFFKSIRSKDVW